MVRLLTRIMALTAILSCVACKTTGPPRIGSTLWHEHRIAEIESAHHHGEISKNEYLTLKNKADLIKVQYRAKVHANNMRLRDLTIKPNRLYHH
jgi:hypothetical protein